MDTVEGEEELRVRIAVAAETAVIDSLKEDRRVLVKYGRVSRLKVTRYFVLHNDVLVYFKTKKQTKSKSSHSLQECLSVCEASKIQSVKYSLKVTTRDKRKIFWLHALHDQEFNILERYIRFASEGRFSSEHIIMQIIQPIHTKHSLPAEFQSSLAVNQLLLSKKTTVMDSLAIISQHKQMEEHTAGLPKINSLLSPRSQFKELEPQSNTNLEDLRQKATRNALKISGEARNKEENKVIGDLQLIYEVKESEATPLILRCRHNSNEKPHFHNTEVLITLGQVSQNNNMFTIQGNNTVDKSQNLSQVFNNMREGSQLTSSPRPMSAYLDFDADIQFSSDEEDQCIQKNINLESVTRQTIYPSPFSSRSYFEDRLQNEILASTRDALIANIKNTDGNTIKNMATKSNNESATAAPLMMIGDYLFQNPPTNLLNHNQTSSTNVSMNFQTMSIQQQLGFGSMIGGSGVGEELSKFKPIDTNSYFLNQQPSNVVPIQNAGKSHFNDNGPCNLSSSTLQNLFFPESQQNYTESPHDSFLSHRHNSHTSSQQKWLLTPQQSISAFSKSKPNRDIIDNSHDYADEEDLEEENISSEESEVGKSRTMSVKQHMFCAGPSRTLISDISMPIEIEQGIIGKQPDRISAAMQKANRTAVIQDYSFDRKTASDTDLFDQEDANFRHSVQGGDGTKQTVELSSQLVQFSHEFMSKAKQRKIMYHARSRSDEIQTRKSGYAPTSVPALGNYSDNGGGEEAEEEIEQLTRESKRKLSDKEDEKNSTLGILRNNSQKYYDEDPFTPTDDINPRQIIEHYQMENMQSIERNRLRGNTQKMSMRSKSANVKLTIDMEECEQVEEHKAAPEIPRIKDKKEFYNKKNISKYIIPKMEASVDLHEITSLEVAFEKGYFYLWSFQLDNATAIFELYRETSITMEYALIEPYLMKIMVCGSKELMSKTEKMIGSFLEYIEACQKDVAKKGDQSSIKCLKNHSKLSLDVLKSEAAIVRGLLQSLLGNKFQSFLSFKSAYSLLKKAKAKVESLSKQNSGHSSVDIVTLSRYYFVSGIFNIGLSMIPTYFLKILSLLGISTDKTFGYECLNKCIELGSIRSHYASLLLCIEFIELNPNLEKSVKIIKTMIKTLPQCPLFYWMAALLSWRFAKPDEALQLINKSLWNCGEILAEQASYLHFEKGWFCVSQFDWKSALVEFEDIAVFTMNIHEIDVSAFSVIAQQRKVPSDTTALLLPVIQRAQSTFDMSRKIILPHKCGLALLISCCHQHIGKIQHMDLWLLITIYLNKHNNSRSSIDEDITKLSGKYLNRINKSFIKYEVLYFVKEITKLREDMLQQMVREISNYYEIHYEKYQDLTKLKNQPAVAIDFASILFLRIVGGCLQQNFSLVYSTTSQLEAISDYIPSDHTYLLHHSHHWLARCYINQSKFVNAKEHLKKCIKFKKSEFSLENKTQKLLQEISQ